MPHRAWGSTCTAAGRWSCGSTLLVLSSSNSASPTAGGCLPRRSAAPGPGAQVALEATYGWYWAADVAAQSGAVVHLAHPLA